MSQSDPYSVGRETETGGLDQLVDGGRGQRLLDI